MQGLLSASKPCGQAVWKSDHDKKSFCRYHGEFQETNRLDTYNAEDVIILFFQDFLLKYLKHKERTADMREKLREIDEKVEVEFNGSTTYRDIEILVSLELN